MKTKDFIKKSKKLYGNKYNYDKTNILSSTEKVCITCPTHGDFYVTLSNHIHSGSECIDCKANERLIKLFDRFIKISNERHDNKYDYSLVNKDNLKNDKIKIICPIHGIFEQNYEYHRSGRGCLKCSLDDKSALFSSNTNDFIKKANKIHNNKYDYSKVVYTLAKNKVEIICPQHDSFWQSPNSHLHPHGCPYCSNFISFYEKLWLDSLGIPNTLENRNVLIKIGNKQFNVDGLLPDKMEVYEYYGDFWHGNPIVFNPNEINPKLNVKFKTLYKRTMNRELILKDAGYKIISVWEYDYKMAHDIPIYISKDII
jgi:hypothetical protein